MTQANTLWGVDLSVTAPFDKAYWLAQPPDVQALQGISDETARETQAKVLALAGRKIDVPIMVWLWDPYLTMLQRQNFGYTWVPSGLQPNIPVVPGAVLPGFPSYDPNNPPAGSIIVSTNIADYPPYAVAPPPVPDSALPIVGPLIFDNIYAYGPGVWTTAPGPKTWNVIQGQIVNQDGVNYVAVFVSSVDGFALHFEKQ